MIISRVCGAIAAFACTLWICCAQAAPAFSCAPAPLSAVDGKYGPNIESNYNREVVGAMFGEYAAASFDAYQSSELKLGAGGNVKDRRFVIADDEFTSVGRSLGSTRWNRFFIDYDGENPSYRRQVFGGLSFDTYVRSEATGSVTIMVAYRGSEPSLGDIVSDLSWVTKWLNPWDQYKRARQEFEAVVRTAVTKFPNKKIVFVTTGHSLGGGLAVHISYNFPCVSAVVFDASFVENVPPNPDFIPEKIIYVYEKKEPFSQIRSLVRGREENDSKIAVYRLKTVSDSSCNWFNSARCYHNMEELAAGSLRMAVDCVKRRDCEFQKKNVNVEVAKVLYCKRYLGLYLPGQRDPPCMR